jgi:hypothetical protein
MYKLWFLLTVIPTEFVFIILKLLFGTTIDVAARQCIWLWCQLVPKTCLVLPLQSLYCSLVELWSILFWGGTYIKLVSICHSTNCGGWRCWDTLESLNTWILEWFFLGYDTFLKHIIFDKIWKVWFWWSICTIWVCRVNIGTLYVMVES